MRPLLTLLPIFGLAAAALSSPVDAGRAETAARHWLAGRAGLSALEAPLQLREIPADDGQTALWLATLEDGGLVWLRGDDRLPPVAGWAPGEAVWPVANPALADWIELQRRDAAGARAADWTEPTAAAAWQTLEAAPAAGPREREMAPLLTSTWDQGWPWNQFCPADEAGPGDHVWAGCVATAMGQVLYYWQKPLEGLGYHDYLHPVYGEQAVQYSGTVYDWDGMSPTAGTAAAALLLYQCAVGVNMDFGPDGSGAFVGTGQNSALRALTSYFRFPDNAWFADRYAYTLAEWAQLIRDEIEAERPVLMRGYGSGGHAFVLDGTQDELFHLNWGWSGWFNGWYAIDGLSPGGMDFSAGNAAIVDLAPNTPPAVTLPAQGVPAGAAFPPLALDGFVEDAQDAPADILWWTEEDGPLSVDIDYLTRIATVEYPAGWTGTALVDFSALDTDGEWTTVPVAFTVGAIAAGPPAAVDDLALVWTPLGVDLVWSAPTTDASGTGPAVVSGYEVHAAAEPWFAPSPPTRLAPLPVAQLAWRHEGAPVATPRFYRVVVLGP